jgi:ADP-L-glycero-D-manno-heptose 6-epimerase
MKYVITGSEGFIGKAVLEALKLRGDYVWQIHQDKNLYNDDTALEGMIEQCDGIFHIGAISDTTEHDPNYMLYWNYTTSKILFDLARKYDKKVVYSSSAANYGSGDGIPNNIYGWSKLLAEEYGMKACERFVALRYFNVYGPGESDKGKMASVAYQAHKAGKFKLFPGDIKRDFVYVPDVVHANLHAMTLERGVFDVGTGTAETFESLVEGMEISYTYHDKNMIPKWYQYFTKADRSKFMPGWKPYWNVLKGTEDYRETLGTMWEG